MMRGQGVRVWGARRAALQAPATALRRGPSWRTAHLGRPRAATGPQDGVEEQPGQQQLGAAAAAPPPLPHHAQEQQTMAKRILRFMGPALVIPLGDPLMTLTDTMFIGRCCSTSELASLGPSNIVFSATTYVFQALQVAAISLISDDLRKGRHDAAEHTFHVALTLALASGLVVMAAMELGAEQLIAGTGVDSALVPLGASYMRIRAFAQPAVLLTMVCQAGLLAQQNSRTPALAVVLAVSVNILSNLVAVAWLGLGLQGAAATTVATQVVGAGALLAASLSARAGLRAGLALPSTSDLLLFGSTMGPLAVTYVCKNVSYILLSTAAATLSMVQLAAHQACFSVWNLMAFCSAPLEQTALAYVPAAASPRQAADTVRLLLGLSVVIGVGAGLLAAAVPLLVPQALTRDPAVWPFMASVAPLGMLAMLLTAADVGATGVLLARRDLRYVARSFVITLSLLAIFMWAGVFRLGWGLAGVWGGLVLFFALRSSQSLGRLLYLGIGGPRGAPAPQQG